MIMKNMSNSLGRTVLVVFALLALTAYSRAQGQPDFSKVEIKTTKLGNNFYTLDGQGGTIGVLTGPDGIFMVDTQFAPLTDKIVAAGKTSTEQHIPLCVQ